ncbi:hypothetical protein U1Q18_019309 [Sarracenia purpurea var. burkii]
MAGMLDMAPTGHSDEVESSGVRRVSVRRRRRVKEIWVCRCHPVEGLVSRWPPERWISPTTQWVCDSVIHLFTAAARKLTGLGEDSGAVIGATARKILLNFLERNPAIIGAKFQRRKARIRFPFVSAQGSAGKKKIRIYPDNILVWACFGNHKAKFSKEWREVGTEGVIHIVKLVFSLVGNYSVLHDKRKARGVWKSQPAEFLGIKGI